MSMFHLHKSSSVWSPYWRDGVCGRVGNLSMSILDDTFGTLAAHAAFNLFLISSFSCSSNVIFCPRYRALSLYAKTSNLMLSTAISFAFILSWILSIFGLFGWIPNPTASVLALNSSNISRNFSSEVEKSSTSSADLRFVRQSSLSLSLMPFCFPATASDRLPRKIATLCWKASSTKGPLPSSPVWSEIRHSSYLLRLFLLVDCKVFAEVSRMQARRRSGAGSTIMLNVLFGRTLSSSGLCWCTAVHPTHGIVAPALSTPLDDHLSDDWAETHLDRGVGFCAGIERDGHKVPWQTVCIVLVGYKLACNCLHPLCRLSCRWPGFESCANFFGVKSAWFRWRSSWFLS